MNFSGNLNKLLLVCTIVPGIINASSTELFSPMPQIYIDIPSPGKQHFEKKALSLITPKDLQNCIPYLESIQQQLTEFFTKITSQSSDLHTKDEPHSSIIPLRDQEKTKATKTTIEDEDIYDEEGWFLDEDLRHAQEGISLLIDFAHRSCPINPTLKKVLEYLDSYYKDAGKSTEFIECTQFVINNVEKLDFSLISQENKQKLELLQSYI